MKLKTKITKLDDVDEAFRGLYAPLDADDEAAGFILQTDRSDEKGTLAEFRKSGIAKNKEIEELRGKLQAFGDTDPNQLEQMRKAFAQVQDDEEQKLIMEGKLPEVLERRTTSMRETYESQIAAQKGAYGELEGKYKTLENQLAQVRVGEMVTGAIAKSKVKVRDGALPFVLNRARDTFKLDENGNPVALRNGKAVYGPSGEPLSMGEFIEQEIKDSPFLFEGGSGGDSRGSGIQGGKRTVDSSSGPTAFADSGLEDIAKGKVQVVS